MKLLLSILIAGFLMVGTSFLNFSANAEGGSSVRNGKKGSAPHSATPSPTVSPSPSPTKP